MLFTVLSSSIDLSPSSQALCKLWREVKRCSHDYYLNEARRGKKALLSSQSAANNVRVLCSRARVQFKVAMQYSFLSNADKSMRFWMDCYRTISQIYQAKDKEFDVEEECRWSAGWCLFKIVSSLKRSKLHDDMEDFVKSFCSIFLATPMNPTSHFHWFSYKMRVTIATFVEDIGGRDYFKGSVHWAETGNQLLKIRGSRSPPPPSTTAAARGSPIASEAPRINLASGPSSDRPALK